MTIRPDQAFTLIELLLAIGLSSLLVLMAVLTFRGVAATMRDIDRLADENRQVRSGFFLVMDDADFWHSHANPAFPYLQRHMSSTDGGNEALDKRPFRPVVWPKDLDDPRNPNWTEAHHPRSWYRNHLRPNVTTGAYVRGSKFSRPGMRDAYVYRPDFGVYDPDPANTNNETYTARETMVIDPAWQSWHLVGDYAKVANCEMTGPVGSREHLAGSRQVQTWHVFGELGMSGCFSYLPAGSPTMIQASSRNEIPANYLDAETRMATNFCKGEIPWSLQANTAAVIDRRLEVLDAPRDALDLDSYPASFAVEFPDHDRLNWAIAMPSAMDAGREDAAGLPRFGFFADFDALATDQHACPIGLSFGDGEGGRGNTYGSVKLSPLAVFLPPVPHQADLDAETYRWKEFDNFVLNPLALLDLNQTFTASQVSFSGRTFYPELQFQLMRDDHQHRTWRVPSRATATELGELSDQEEAAGGLATTVLRYQYNGLDKARCQITVQDARGEKSLQIRVNVITTSFRGARQYWGRKSGLDGVSDGLGNRVRLGDRYE